MPDEPVPSPAREPSGGASGGTSAGASAGGGPELRAAATIMLVRDGAHEPAPLEVLMVRRNLKSEFVGGAYVFPGGGVDPADGGAEAERCCVGRSDTEASEILGIPEGGLAYWVAVLRECFEEAGVLLAYDAYGGEGEDAQGVEPTVARTRGGGGARSTTGSSRPMLSLADPQDASRFAHHRLEINGGQRRFLDVCREEGLRLAVDQVHYFAHWITPMGAPRRYDTRFFVAAAPPGQVPAHDQGETIAAEWVSPSDALARHREGDIELIFPTIRNLQAISRFATTSELLAAAAAAARIPTILPRVVADGPGIRILLPGDPGYDDAANPRPSAGTDEAADFHDVVRAISMAANTAGGEGPDAPDRETPTGVVVTPRDST